MRGPPWPTTPPDSVDLDEMCDEVGVALDNIAEEYGTDTLSLLISYVETHWPGRSVVKILEPEVQA